MITQTFQHTADFFDFVIITAHDDIIVVVTHISVEVTRSFETKRELKRATYRPIANSYIVLIAPHEDIVVPLVDRVFHIDINIVIAVIGSLLIILLSIEGARKFTEYGV